jgi:hypothetical protein
MRNARTAALSAFDAEPARRLSTFDLSAFRTNANSLEPYANLRKLFAELPKAKTVEVFEAMLPFNTT